MTRKAFFQTIAGAFALSRAKPTGALLPKPRIIIANINGEVLRIASARSEMLQIDIPGQLKHYEVLGQHLGLADGGTRYYPTGTAKVEFIGYE